jgi:hypothetical protein
MAAGGLRSLHIEDVSKRFFFEKKKQKTSGPAGCGTSQAGGTMSKSFLVLFFKKEHSASLGFSCS